MADHGTCQPSTSKGTKRKLSENKHTPSKPGRHRGKGITTGKGKRKRVHFSSPIRKLVNGEGNISCTNSKDPRTDDHYPTSPDSALCRTPGYASSSAAGSLLHDTSIGGCTSGIGGELSDVGTPAWSSDHESFTSLSVSTRRVMSVYSPERLLCFLQVNFIKLKENLDTVQTDILDFLSKVKHVITDEDAKRVQGEKLPKNKNEMLIHAIADSKYFNNNVHIIRYVLEALSIGNCKDLADKFAEDIEEKDYEWPDEKYKMDTDRILGQLERHKDAIVKEVSHRFIIDDLFVEGVISRDDHRIIKNVPDRLNKSVATMWKYIVKNVEQNPESRFLGFCEVLTRKGYDEIAEKLLKDKSSRRNNEMLLQWRVTHFQENYTTSDEGEDSDTDVVRLTLDGDGRCRDMRAIEKAIVEYNKDDVGEDFAQEMMKVGCDLDDMQIGSIVLYLKPTTDQAKVDIMTRLKEEPPKLLGWLQTLLTHNHILKIRDAGIRRLNFTVKIHRPNLPDRCLCKIRKEHIVDHFSMLEKEMQSVSDITRAFANFNGYEDNERHNFEVLHDKTDAYELLSTILTSDDIGLCLLQRKLVETKQEQLLSKLVANEKFHQLTPTSRDVKKCYTLIVEQLESRLYVNVINGRKGAKHVVEKIMKIEERKERNKVFLDFLIGLRKPKVVMKFLEALQQRGMHYLAELIKPKPRKQVDKAALQAARVAIIHNVDPLKLTTLVKRKEMLEEDFDNICRHKQKQSRAKNMLRHISSGDQSLINCFMDALYLAGYTYTVNKIQSKTGLSDVEEAITAHADRIYHSVEPKALRDVFVDRKEMTEGAYDDIDNLDTRQERCTALLKALRDGGLTRAECFIDALMLNGYDDLVDMINQRTGEFKECPRLHYFDLDGDTVNVLKGGIGFKVMKVEETENNGNEEREDVAMDTEEVAFDATKAMFESHLKQDHVQNWILSQHTSRKRQKAEEDEASSPVKRICLESGNVSPPSSSGFLTARCGDQTERVNSDFFSSKDSTGRTLSDDVASGAIRVASKERSGTVKGHKDTKTMESIPIGLPHQSDAPINKLIVRAWDGFRNLFNVFKK